MLQLVFCEYARHVEISISLLAMMGDRDDHIISFDKLVIPPLSTYHSGVVRNMRVAMCAEAQPVQ